MIAFIIPIIVLGAVLATAAVVSVSMEAGKRGVAKWYAANPAACELWLLKHAKHTRQRSIADTELALQRYGNISLRTERQELQG